MSYSISALTTQSDCDRVILSAQNKKSSFEFRKTNLVYRQNSSVVNGTSVEAELTMVEAKIAALETVINSLPEGALKRDQITQKMGLEYRQRILEDRSTDNGIVGQLDRENEIALFDLRITEMTSFIAAVEQRKSELPA